MRFQSQKIVSYCLRIGTHNPGKREVDFQPSPLIGGDKINMLKEGRKTAEKTYCTPWTHIWITALREVDLEPSPKRGSDKINMLEACILKSLQTESHTNQPRQTLSDRLELEKSLTKSPNPMLSPDKLEFEDLSVLLQIFMGHLPLQQ